MLNIGVYSDSYPDKRMILNKVPNCQYIQIPNKRENYGRALRFLGKKAPFLRYTELYAQGVHFTLDTPFHPEVDVIHTFNRVCLHDSNKWIATFEKTFPEYFNEENRINFRTMNKQLPLLLSEKCLAVLPMSQWAYQYELWLMKQFADPAETSAVEKKMKVLYPPQELLAEPESVYEKHKNRNTVSFLYVGAQIKRKGGVELLKVFDRLAETYDNFSVTLVGDFNQRYAGFYLSDGEKEKFERILTHSKWLHYFERLSNEEILNCAKASHVGILPTLGDTFGFSVLEMQACGCPVITTDRQALPEINNDDCGWMLDTQEAVLPHGDDFAHYSREEIDLLSSVIQQQLLMVITDVLEHPETVERKAIQSLHRISAYHDPQQYGTELFALYQKAVH